MFFDRYDRFYETSRTAASANRLHLRYEAIIGANRDLLDGARVLDLASHDGRWSFAALQAGAAHVTGIEARPELVDNAERTFAEYGVDPTTYGFVLGDIFRVLNDRPMKVDVVLCLGFVYHTLRYPELLRGIRDADPRHLVVDTKVIASEEPVVALKVNRTGVQSNATNDRVSHRRKVVAGWPSVPALETMLDVYDFEVEDRYDWPALMRSHPEIPARAARDYQRGSRVTLRCRTRRDPVPA